MCVCVNVWACVYGFLWRSEEGVGFLGDGGTDSCEPPMGAGNGTPILCKSSVCCNPLSLTLAPKAFFLNFWAGESNKHKQCHTKLP